MFLGIEIGGTKLQLAVGAGDGSPFVEFVRRDVDPARQAAGIREQIREAVTDLRSRHAIERVGFGFGGPVRGAEGRVITSHQIDGWTDFPLRDWCREELGLPARLGNDCDVAALAEARFGAGRRRRIVLYVTVGTGIGGGLVVDGTIHGTFRPAACEIGHLRPGLRSRDPHQTVEGASSGRGIEQAARAWLDDQSRRSPPEIRCGQLPPSPTDAGDLRARCGHETSQLTARHVADAARAGNATAASIIGHAVEALGWGIAQAVTLLAPEVVVVGGGVSLIGEDLFFTPLRSAVQMYVFTPLAGEFQVVAAALGEDVVVHGALALAASAAQSPSDPSESG